MNLIINADDLGISPGVNQAVRDAHLNGGLSHASIMVNTLYFKDALKHVIKNCPRLKIGLHFNLTYGRPVCAPPEVKYLINAKGYFKRSIFELMLLKEEKILKQIELELEAQIKKALDYSIPLTHLDGHLHVHTIPLIYQMVKKLAGKYQINRIRVINETPALTFRLSRTLSFLNLRSLASYFLLKRYTRINQSQSESYFYSLLLSCQFKTSHFDHLFIPRSYQGLEIMLHPGNPQLDQNCQIENELEKKHLLSAGREKEYQVCLKLARYLPVLKKQT